MDRKRERAPITDSCSLVPTHATATTQDTEFTIAVVGDPSPKLEVVSGAFPGKWATLAEGVKQFSDREYVLTQIPKKLVGSRFFQGPCHAQVVSLKVQTIGAVVVLEGLNVQEFYKGDYITISPPVTKTLLPSMKTTSPPDSLGFWQHGT